MAVVLMFEWPSICANQTISDGLALKYEYAKACLRECGVIFPSPFNGAIITIFLIFSAIPKEVNGQRCQMKIWEPLGTFESSFSR